MPACHRAGAINIRQGVVIFSGEKATNSIDDATNIINGYLTGAAQCPSPNVNSRPNHQPISLLVIHNISLPPREFGTGCVQAFFTNQLDSSQHPYFHTIADIEVSAHLFIERTGEITQFAAFNQRA